MPKLVAEEMYRGMFQDAAFKGMRQDGDPTDLAAGEMREVQNLELCVVGRMRVRPGMARTTESAAAAGILAAGQLDTTDGRTVTVLATANGKILLSDSLVTDA